MTEVMLAALAALASTLAACGGSENEGTAERAAGAAAPVTAARLADEPPGGVVEDCSTRSEASFPGAFTDPRNVVIGPLVLVGAAYTDPATVVEFGGNKFPLLVRAGHRVTVELSPRTRRVARPHGPSHGRARLLRAPAQ